MPKSTRLGTKPVPKPAEAVEGTGDAVDASEEGTPESTEDASGEPPAPQARPPRATKLPTKKQSKPETLAPSEPIEDTSESEEPSVGPAEVDPSIRPLEEVN